MKIEILKSANFPEMEGKTIEFDSIDENPDGMPFADCGKGMVLADLTWCLAGAMKNNRVACVGGREVFNTNPVTGTLVYGNSPKNLVVINEFRFV